MKNHFRNCPVCLSDQKINIHTQIFENFSEGSLLNHYNIVACDQCGAAYADDIPPQEKFDRYYSYMSKYEYDVSDGIINEYDADIFGKSANFLAPLIEHNNSIADIGCATGALLNEFKKRGFYNLTGFDPSASCCRSGQRLYGIDMRQSTINQLSTVTDRFDIVMMSGVLEHLCDVETSLDLLKSLLKPGGSIYLGVPDASRYSSHFGAPFQYFSMEHVNYFAPVSLANLMLRHGFETKKIQRFDRYLGPKSIEPVIFGLFSPSHHGTKDPVITHDTETEASLRGYIKQSEVIEESIQRIIEKLVESQVPLIVWAVGTHTLRLLKTSLLSNANIIAFVDSNKNYQGKMLHDRPIIAPSEIQSLQGEILISSQVAEDEIKEYIINSLILNRKIYTLYSSNAISK